MPQYTFVCRPCEAAFEVNMEIKHYTNEQRCPKCGSKDVGRDFSADRIMVDDGNPLTIGMLGEKNARKRKQNGYE